MKGENSFRFSCVVGSCIVGNVTKTKPDFSKAASAITPPRRQAEWLTTQQFARAVDVPVVDIVRKHRAGVFVAAKSGGRGRGHRNWYSIAQIDAYKRQIAAEGEASNPFGENPFVRYTAEEAKLVFASLQEGLDLQQCVIELGLHPSTVRAIAGEWADMKGDLFVSSATLRKIDALGPSGPIPIKSEADLLEVVTIALGEGQCAVCRKEGRAVCRRCVDRMTREARKEAEVKVTAAAEATLKRTVASLESAADADQDEDPSFTPPAASSA